MDKDDEYRRQAAEAQSLADRSISAADKSAWLRIAQGWLSLVRRARQSDRDVFDAETKARGTGQEPSDNPTNLVANGCVTCTDTINGKASHIIAHRPRRTHPGA